MPKIVTILAAASTSGSESTGSIAESFVALETDAAFTSGDITFSVANQATDTFKSLRKDDGTAYKIAGAVANSFYALDKDKFIGARHVKVITPGVLLAAPTNVVATPSGTGGTLAAGTYYYKVTALDAYGQTLPSAEASAVTTGATSSVALTWTAVTGAVSYRIYRGTATNAQNTYFTSTAANFTDVGAAGTAGTVPTTTLQQNTTSITLHSRIIK